MLFVHCVTSTTYIPMLSFAVTKLWYKNVHTKYFFFCMENFDIRTGAFIILSVPGNVRLSGFASLTSLIIITWATSAVSVYLYIVKYRHRMMMMMLVLTTRLRPKWWQWAISLFHAHCHYTFILTWLYSIIIPIIITITPRRHLSVHIIHKIYTRTKKVKKYCNFYFEF